MHRVWLDWKFLALSVVFLLKDACVLMIFLIIVYCYVAHIFALNHVNGASRYRVFVSLGYFLYHVFFLNCSAR